MKKIIRILKAIKGICNTHPNGCDGCPFFDAEMEECDFKEIPCSWDIDEYKNKLIELAKGGKR